MIRRSPLLALLSLSLLLALAACSNSAAGPEPTKGDAPTSQPAPRAEGTERLPDTAPEGLEIATFAGGCFWCMEGPFDKTPGVVSTISGYTDGKVPHPTYKQVSAGRTGHTEAIRVTYDPKKISYAQLLEVFWHNIDPTQADGQFCDHGDQYRTGIYAHSPEQKVAAEASKIALEASRVLPGRVVTEIEDASAFYAAEDYHQDFYLKNPGHYQRYRTGCGRDARLKKLWGEKAGH